jgi:two-component system sensor histidine kinase YesM
LNNLFNKFYKKKHSIYSQIIKSQLILSTLPIIFVYLCSYSLIYYISINKNTQYLDENALRINKEIDNYFQIAINSYDILNSNQELRRFLVSENRLGYNKKSNLDTEQISKLSYIFSPNEFYQLELFDLNKRIITDTKMKSTPTINEFWYEDFVNKSLTNHIYFYEFEHTPTLTYIVGLYNFTESKLIGFTKFNFDYYQFKSFFNKEINPSTKVLVLDKFNNKVYSSLSNGNLENFLLKVDSHNFNNYINVHKKKYLISVNTSTYTNWQVISLMSIDDELKEIELFGQILFFAIILLILINISIAFRNANTIVKPIKDLISSIKKADTQKLDSYNQSNSNLIEIRELEQSYEKLMNEIQNLIEKNHKINLLRIESQLNALQQKINPHFLFNTLELINSYAILEDSPNTSLMIQKLGNLFRYNLKQSDIVTIEKEFDYIRDYLFLQKIRFDEELNVIITLNEKMRNYKIPKLTLQPLVENSIKYGFNDLGHMQNTITIEAYEDNNNIVILIKDNGVGMDQNKIDTLNKSLHDDMDNFHSFVNRNEHIGLRNVNSRLCLLYKINQSLYIKSSLYNGTSIKLTFPI